MITASLAGIEMPVPAIGRFTHGRARLGRGARRSAGDPLPALVELVDRALGLLVALRGPGAALRGGPRGGIGQLVLEHLEHCFGLLDLALESLLVLGGAGARAAA